MNNTLLKIRYYLEIIALPAFIFLIIHLSGHGFTTLFLGEEDHGHAPHEENIEVSEEEMKHLISSYSHSREREYCEEAGGEWLDEFYECEMMGSTLCEPGTNCQQVKKEFCENDLHGTYQECASPCRNDPESEFCITSCAEVCSVDPQKELHEELLHEDEHPFEISEIGHFFWNLEFTSGIFFLILFAWLWHQPSLRKWVPCTHEHCHSESQAAHILAIVAFCLHLFPEAGVRNALFDGAFGGEIIHALGWIAFAAHFLVDVIVILVLSSYFGTKKQFGLSLVVIAITWMVAFILGEQLTNNIPASAEAILFLVSAFLLAMFVHKPHRPVTECKTCDHHQH